MPAKSIAERKTAQKALHAQQGKSKKSRLDGKARDMAESTSKGRLQDLAATKRKGKNESQPRGRH